MNCCRVDVLSPVYESDPTRFYGPATLFAEKFVLKGDGVTGIQKNLPDICENYGDKVGDLTDTEAGENTAEDVALPASAHTNVTEPEDGYQVVDGSATGAPVRSNHPEQSMMGKVPLGQEFVGPISDRSVEQQDEGGSYLFYRHDIYDNCKFLVRRL